MRLRTFARVRVAIREALSPRATALLRQSGWTLLGQVLPLLAALLAIPTLIAQLGNVRFGFLSIAWMLIGYFGLFDFGIGRAMTHSISKRIAEPGESRICDVLWTGLAALLTVGLALALAVSLLARPLVTMLLDVPPALQEEAGRATTLVAFAIPLVVVSSGLRGVLEAKLEFKAVSLALVPVGVLAYAGPAVVSLYSTNLVSVVAALIAARTLALGVLIWLCASRVRNCGKPEFSIQTLRGLLQFGSWMTVSNIVSPIMSTMDRLFIGSFISLGSVTYYVTPFEIVSRLQIIPSAIATVTFPEFSRMATAGRSTDTLTHFKHALVLVACALTPPVLFFVLFSGDFLAAWVSQELAEHGAIVMKVLAIGMLINGLSYIPFAYIQGKGRSDITAKFHIAELVVYVPLIYIMAQRFGLVGVAVSWLLRVSLDAVLLFGYTKFSMRS